MSETPQSGSITGAPRFLSVRKAPTQPLEILVYDQGRSRVFPMAPGAALALAESLIEAASKRLHELADRDPAARRLLRDEETI